jgi:hypothetical protein
MAYHSRRWTTTLLLSATLSACSSATEPASPTTGTIELNVVTTGTDLAADGFRLAIDGGAEQPLPANGTVTWSGGAGSHTIAITGLAFNCDLTTNPATANHTRRDDAHGRAGELRAVSAECDHLHQRGIRHA